MSMTATAEPTQPNREVVYKNVEGLAGEPAELKLHIFNPKGHSVTEPRPAIVFFFGGGWMNGAPGQFYPHCQYLARRGIVAIAAEYRTQKGHGTTPDACVRDGKSAMRWVRSHAAELGIDPDQILAGGGSAGGHVAAATALTEGFEEDGEDLSVSPRPAALVLFNPVFDNGPGGYGHDRVKSYWESFSPMHNIAVGAPPTIVLLGTEDALIPVATAETYKARMEAVGSRCDLFLYEGQPHGFFNFKNREYYDKTVAEMDHFLVSLGYLEPLK